MNIAIVGATGNVGRKILEVLERKKLPIKELFLVASPETSSLLESMLSGRLIHT